MDESFERLVQTIVQRVLEMQGGSTSSAGFREVPQEKVVLVATEDARSAILEMTDDLRLGRKSFALFSANDDGAAPTAEFARAYGVADASRLKEDVAERFTEVRLLRVSLPTIARLAHLVVTDPISELALAALSEDVPVYLESIRYRPDYLKLARPLRREFDALVRKLRDFGVEELATARFRGGTATKERHGASPHGPEDRSPRIGRTHRRAQILTVNDVQDLMDAERRELVLDSGSRLTDLAREYVERHGITVRTQA